MNPLRPALAIVALGMLAACTDGTAQTPSSPSTSATAETALSAATAGLATGNYHFTMSSPRRKTDGLLHQPSNSSKETIALDRKVFHRVRVGWDEYVRTDASGWQHTDYTRLPAKRRPSSLREQPDRTGATALLAAARDVTVDGSTMTGHIDGTHLPSSLVPSGTPGGLLGKAPFTARLDDQGRLVHFVLKIPARKDDPVRPAATWTLTIDGYGRSPAQQAPAKFEELPDDTYEHLYSPSHPLPTDLDDLMAPS
ncbi:hypothetical protein [Couchioplanes azureus]|uniref:hypothetical protein n=1 Tax=Couchioplanes caeruleus TaxID=56438 RepID=UPI00167063DB|nr:hypothetical protein [Couchioplanes caeruleus]